jgi:MFS family permease
LLILTVPINYSAAPSAGSSPSTNGFALLNQFVQQRFLNRLPPRNRPALYFDMWSNVGLGAYSAAVYPLALVVLERILHADLSYQALLSIMFLGSNLFSPLVTYLGRTVPMRLLVIVPNLLVAALLLTTTIRNISPLWFTLIIGMSIVIRVVPRVAEMNMFRLLYPVTHRARAIGTTKSIGTASGLAMTIVGWYWLGNFPAWYSVLFCMMSVLLLMSSWFYARIPVNRRTPFIQDEQIHPLRAFKQGLRIFFQDRLFVKYQIAFALAGIANHIAIMLLPRVLGDSIGASTATITFLVAVWPNLVIIVSAQVWSRFMDGMSPMFARGLISCLQAMGFVGYAVGGMTGQLWPIVVGTTLLGISNGGGMINWLTGSMYFAPPDKISLYNGIHATLTGVRGLIGPTLGLFLFAKSTRIANVELGGCNLESGVFLISAALTVTSAAAMFVLHYARTAEAVARPA